MGDALSRPRIPTQKLRKSVLARDDKKELI